MIDGLVSIYWEAFWSLNSARQHGMGGPQPITITDIMAYCAMAGIADPTERMTILRLVQAMDGAFMRWAVEKQKQEAAKRKT